MVTDCILSCFSKENIVIPELVFFWTFEKIISSTIDVCLN